MKILCAISISLFAVIAASGQCVSTPTDPCVSVHQSTLDRVAKDLDTLKVANDTIAKQAIALATTDTERAAWLSYKAAADSTIAVLQKGIVDREAVVALQNKALALYEDLVEKLTAKINAPQSAWSKFIHAVRDIALLAGGIAIGRRL